MPHTKKELELLGMIKRYTEGKATAEEIHFLDLYFENFENHPEFLETKSEEERKAIGENLWAKIMDATFFPLKKRGKTIPITSKNWYKVAVAASVILLVAVGMYFFMSTHSTKIAKNTTQKKFDNDISPGGYNATLTLANGSTIILNNAQNGTITQQGNAKILKLANGQLAYNSLNEKPKEVLYNTITTPRGGQYQLTLSDGTKVWLNAASSLRYPASFSGKERRVELTGEGYFEVAHNAEMPFHVKVNNMDVSVLGTHFNVNAYGDEGVMKTTLLEGSVKVNEGNENVLITPGEQAQVKNSTDKIEVKKDVDVDAVVAWKNGLFHFENADVQTVMRQLSRWYDVEVIYKGVIPEREFEGEMQKNLNLSQVLKLLSQNNINFKIEGRQLIVTP